MGRVQTLLAGAAVGGGAGLAGLGTAGLVSYGLLKVEARLARRSIGRPFDGSPEDTSIFGTGLGDPIQLLVLGDSLAAGLGAENRFQTLGGAVATGVAALTGRPTQLTNVAEVGAESTWLDGQVSHALDLVPHPDVALISVGGNDATHGVPTETSARHLARAVRRLRASGAEVVVATCPDLGTIAPLPQPLKTLSKHRSRALAAAQTVAAVEAGGRTVSLGDLLRRDFLAEPDAMFSVDGFHPSPVGYARAASVILPTVCAALGLWAGEASRGPDRLRGERVDSLEHAAQQAVRTPGAEVSAAGGSGRRRLALLLRRRRPDGPPEHDADLDDLDDVDEADELDAGTHAEAHAAAGTDAHHPEERQTDVAEGGRHDAADAPGRADDGPPHRRPTSTGI